jgi:hypothetical protein
MMSNAADGDLLGERHPDPPANDGQKEVRPHGRTPRVWQQITHPPLAKIIE